jgi:hypothetical protein
MNEKEEDVVHAGILSNSQKLPEFRPILEFATDKVKAAALVFERDLLDQKRRREQGDEGSGENLLVN